MVRCVGPFDRARGETWREVRVTLSKMKTGWYSPGRRLARDVDARADVRMEPLVAEELVLLRRWRRSAGGRSRVTRSRVVCDAVDVDCR